MKHIWRYIIGVILVTGLALGGGILHRQSIYDRTYAIGFENEPPFHFPDAQGQPTGLVVDILNEAARRTGIRLRWSFQANLSSEGALRSGAVDLWPLMTIREVRKPYVHFTDPYRESEQCLIVRAERPYRTPEDLAGATVWHSGLPINRVVFAQAMPRSKVAELDDALGLMRKVCRGEADAVYMDEFTVVSTLMNGADCGGSPLRAITVPSSRGQLAIGARFEAADAADILRGAISDMYEDGTLSGLIGRWTYFTGRSMEQSSALVQSRRRERIMLAATVGAVLLCVLTVWLAWSIRRQSLRARRAEAERSRLADQLQQAQRLEGIGRLAGGVAHDFNNLLTVINGYADLMKDDHRLPLDLREQAAQIAEAGGQAANLTQQLLAFSRKQVIQALVLNLNTEIASMATMLRRMVGEDVALETSLAADPATVKVDPSQLRQVVMNLAVNSRDAMPRGGRLRIETSTVNVDAAEAQTHSGAAAGTYVRMAVSDTGVGMPAEVLGHIVEPVFTTKPKGEGTGLGLSMVYGVVQQNGGWLDVRSTPGQGTTISVYLPQVSDDPAPDAPSDGALPATMLGHETILLVEDQPSVRLLASTVLRERGYRLLEAETAEAALALAQAHEGPIDLLLTDVVLPGLTGKDLAEALLRVRPSLRVLFASGYAEDVVVHRGVVNSGICYLPKPYAPQVLAEKVREVLDNPPA